MRSIPVASEKRMDGYVAYPPGLKSAITGAGGIYAGALADARLAIRFHAKTSGAEV